MIACNSISRRFNTLSCTTQYTHIHENKIFKNPSLHCVETLELHEVFEKGSTSKMSGAKMPTCGYPFILFLGDSLSV